MKDMDWKKRAYEDSETMAEKMERAFMSLAYSDIESKAGDLARDPHRVGFEVVYSNDDSTRMVGMFGFRIGDELLYAPVFFLNGEVKGTDCLHRTSTKTVVPLTKEWARYLIEKYRKPVEGRGVPKSETMKHPAGIAFSTIAAPPSYKRACAGVFEAFGDLPDGEFFKKASGELLRSFLVEDGGFKAMSILAGAAEADPGFTEKLAFSLPPDSYAPPMGAAFEAVKAASAADAGKQALTLFTGMPPEDASDTEKEVFFKKGYMVRDTRVDHNTVSLDDAEYSGINSPGVYKVPLPDSSGMDTVVVAVERSVYDMVRETGEPCAKGVGCEGSCHRDKDYRTVSLDDGAAGWFSVRTDDVNQAPAGIFDKELADAGLPEDPEVGKACHILDLENGTMSSQALKPTGIKKGSDGTRLLSFIGPGGDETYELVQHQGSECGVSGTGFAGSMVRFVPVDASPATESSYRNFNVADRRYPSANELVRHFVADGTYKKAHIVRKDGGSYHLGAPHGRHLSEGLTADGMKLALASGMNIRFEDAEALVEAAGGVSRRCGFTVAAPMTKQAFDAMPYTLDAPEFRDDYDAYFGLRTSMPEQHVLGVRHPVNEAPESMAGDGWDPAYADGLPPGAVLGTPPAELAGLAKRMGSPNVFEHGVVGGLLTSYDNPAIFDKYLPKLEECVDALGRMTFTLYWKPGQLQDIYGADDMGGLEEEILSNFKSLGDLLLDLLKKSAQLKRVE